ncbi:hypothetical protein VTJ83DRAFT_2828 [Remersonia thermophila]|uniref:Rhodopsin domain-containing protein n=1 Tax=Remersonia thermophila TaxID=72144 RepID=A0ABR4DCA7_9PEZI
MSSNVENGEPLSTFQGNLATKLVACSAATLVLVTVLVCLRFYIRFQIIRKVGLDDIALGLTVGFVWKCHWGCSGLSTALDFIMTLFLSKRSPCLFLKLVFFSALGYHSTIMLLRAAFLLQYRRVLPLPRFQLLCDIGLALLVVWTVAGLVGGLLVCLPLSGNWDPRNLNWTCDRRLTFWTAQGIAHVVSDVLILIMPMPLLKTLPLPRAHKIILIGLFSLGFFTCVISGIRLSTLRDSLKNPDMTVASCKTVFWSVSEISCSIFCLCIPTLRPLLGRCGCDRRRDGGSEHAGFMSPSRGRLQGVELSESTVTCRVDGVSAVDPIVIIPSTTPLSQDVESLGSRKPRDNAGQSI